MSTPPDLGPLPEGKPRAWLQEPKVQRILGRHLIRGVRTVEPTEEDRQFAELDGDLVVPLYDEAERQRCYMLGVAAASQWMPIETAPKDGVEILVFAAGSCYVVGWGSPDCEWWCVDDNKHGPYPLRGSAPTHWMPLPSAPTKDGG